jgi:D-galacturonate reductase
MQGLTMYCAGNNKGALLKHFDQYRGVEYCYAEKPQADGATVYAEPSPDYFQYVNVGGDGLLPVGYGYRSLEHIIRACIGVAGSTDPSAALQKLDDEGIIATPANSRYNELVMEAGRLSILNGAREAVIDYEKFEVALR